MTYFLRHAAAIGLIVLGVAWFIWAKPAHAVQDKQRRLRLVALGRGAKEQFFEERRELESYQSRRPAWYRWMGMVFIVLGIGGFFV